MVGSDEMLDLVENVAKIAKITNYRRWSIVSDEVCPEKTYVGTENMCRNCREKVLVLEK